MAFTENAIEELTEIITKQKNYQLVKHQTFMMLILEKSVSQEINQIKQQMISIGNVGWGNKFIFSGHKTLTRPFDEDGNYYGDNNRDKDRGK